VRNIDSSVKVKIDFLAVSSYGASTRTSGIVRIVKDIDTDIKGCEVLIVEDIMDTGLTLSYLSRLMMERQPRGLKICVLLDKPERHQTEVMIDYCGFTIPDEFVVGYGLDYAGLWRNLPLHTRCKAFSIGVKNVPSGKRGGNNLGKMMKNLGLYLILIVLVVSLVNMFMAPMQPSRDVTPLSYSEFLNQVDKGNVAEVTVDGSNITGRLKDGRAFQHLRSRHW